MAVPKKRTSKAKKILAKLIGKTKLLKLQKKLYHWLNQF